MEAIGPYTLGAPLGQGGMGSVWLAHHPIHGWPVAIKRVHRTLGVDPLSEVRAIAAVHHEHIVRVLDFGADEAEVWIAMERASHSLADQPPTRWTEVRVVLESVLLALAHAHARGILHLDVKPENVLFASSGAGGRWLLADFGLARGSSELGEHGVRGTPSFMAPEQFVGDPAHFVPGTDLYAVGCLAGVLVSGRPPFRALSVQELAQAHRFRDPPPLAPILEVPDGFEAWWLRLLEKAPEDRYRLAADALAALEALGAASEPGVVALYRADTFRFDLDDPVHLPSPAPVAEAVAEAATSVIRARTAPSPELIDLRVLPLIGRVRELEQLREHLEVVRSSGRARVVRIEGPVGIGRSHLARSFASAANEAGLALLGLSQLEGADRPVVVLADAPLILDGPALVLVCSEATDAEAHRIALSPLRTDEITRLTRNLCHLDESLAARVAHMSNGHPGQAVALVRGWAAAGKLIDGPFGFTVADEDLASTLPADHPLLPLAWSVEETPELALALLEPRLEAATAGGNPSEALWLVDLAERALVRSPQPSARLAWRCATVRSGSLVAMGQLGAALVAAKLAVERARALGDASALAASLLQLAHICRFRDEDPSPLLEEAERIATDPLTIARARATRGSQRIVERRLDEARELLESAAQLLEDNGIQTFLGTTLLWLGNTWAYRDQYAEAETVHLRALAAFRTRGHAAGVHQTLGALFNAAIGLEQDGRARVYLDAMRESDDIGSPWLQSQLLADEALLLERAGALEEAETLLRQSLAVAAEGDIAPDHTRICLARVLLLTGRAGEAATHLAAIEERVGGTGGHALSALRLASLAPSDPRWEALLAELQGARNLPSHVNGLLRRVADGLDGDNRSRVSAILDRSDGRD